MGENAVVGDGETENAGAGSHGGDVLAGDEVVEAGLGVVGMAFVAFVGDAVGDGGEGEAKAFAGGEIGADGGDEFGLFGGHFSGWFWVCSDALKGF